MRENFTYQGEWFLPEKPENKKPGTLTHDFEKGTYLELIGSLDKFKNIVKYDDTFEPKIILGFTTNGKAITLYKCRQIGYSKSIPGKETTKILIKFTFIGAHFYNPLKLKFKSVTASLQNLDEWLRISGFKAKSDSKFKKIRIEHELPDPIEFDLDRDLKGIFGFRNYQSYSNFKMIIEQRAEYIIESTKEEISFENILDELRHFQKFLTIVTHENSYAKSIVVKTDNFKKKINDKEYPKEIKVFFQSSTLPNISHSRISREFLFNYEDIRENFEEIIQRWYLNKELINPVINQIFHYLVHRVFDENRFLDIIQAIETFHRRFRKNEVLPKKDYKIKKKEILDAVDDKHRKWLEDILYYKNEPSLHKRLEEMIKEFSNKTIERMITDADKFIKDAKNSRNYYTHFDKSMERKALKGKDLFFLTEKLKVILICAILFETGFKMEQIEQLLERNTYYGYLNLFMK